LSMPAFTLSIGIIRPIGIFPSIGIILLVFLIDFRFDIKFLDDWFSFDIKILVYRV
jgi:hypothetical protein